MLSPEERAIMMSRLEQFPEVLEALVSPLSEQQLRTPFLEGQWTVAQNVHHLADAHMNGFIRFKLLLTETNPTVKPYDQDPWALTADYDLPITLSLGLLRALHSRWIVLLRSFSASDWARTGVHPSFGDINMDWLLKLYSDHCESHEAQIRQTLAAQ
jgi:hypothetical protein